MKKKQIENKTYQYDIYMEDGSKVCFINSKDTPAKIIDEITGCNWYILYPDYNTTINCNKIVKIKVEEFKTREAIE